MKIFARYAALGAATFGLALMPSGSANAQIVAMTGTILNTCILTVSTPGLLVPSATGTELGTAQAGGLAASLSVIATGTSPTITFSAPVVTGPSSGGARVEFVYGSTGGANRAFDTSPYVYPMNRLLDTITINGRATNANGFSSGLYTMSATATCSQ